MALLAITLDQCRFELRLDASLQTRLYEGSSYPIQKLEKVQTTCT